MRPLSPIVALAALLVASCLKSDPAPPTATAVEEIPAAKKPAVHAGPAIDVGNGAAMDQEFRDNLLAAERKWIGKRVRILHGVGFMGRDKNKEFYISHQYGGYLYPAADELEKFEAVKIGDTVIVEGTIAGYERDASDPVWGIRLNYRDVKLIEIRKPKG
jgi:hypothetical protein